MTIRWKSDSEQNDFITEITNYRFHAEEGAMYFLPLFLAHFQRDF